VFLCVDQEEVEDEDDYDYRESIELGVDRDVGVDRDRSNIVFLLG
jgi:hypothetical protein